MNSICNKKSYSLHKSIFSILIVLLIGCKSDDEGPATSNSNPEEFSVSVSNILGSSATLTWETANDIDGDKVTYAIWLEGEEVISGLQTLAFELTGLAPETGYSGRVIALDENGGSTESLVAFNTVEMTILWQKVFGGVGSDIARSVLATSDGGYLISGISDFDNPNPFLLYDWWIMKLDAEGNRLWDRRFGGSDTDQLHSVTESNDGGYVIVGGSASDDGDLLANNGTSDFWIIKLDVNGNLTWQTSLGGFHIDEARGIHQTQDGGYIVGGRSLSDDGDVGKNQGSTDAWVVKLDAGGSMVWQQSYGGSDRDRIHAITELDTGELVFFGYSESSDGDVNQNNGSKDFWVVKLSSFGDIIWERSFGGSQDEIGEDILQTSDGGFILCGSAESSNRDLSKNQGEEDYWIVKLDNGGNILWENSYGGSGFDIPNSIIQLSNDGYVIVGTSDSNNGDVGRQRGDGDYWIINLDEKGELIWETSYGGSGLEIGYSICNTSDAGFLTAGASTSIDGDVTSNSGAFDYWILKIK